MSDEVLVERSGPLGLLTLNRPAARNPLDRDTAAALLRALTELFADDTVRCVGVTGAGPAFCAGGDLRQMQALSETSGDRAFAWPESIVELHRVMLRAPKPVVAAVNGPALAGGMGLAGMCDIVLATKSATFGLPEARLGLFPMIIVAHLARALPRKVLQQMMLTAQPITAAEAHRVGLVATVYPDAPAMRAGLQDCAETIAGVSPAALRMGRQAFAVLSDIPAGLALEAAQLFNVPFFLGDDLREGTAAFFAKRPPRWQQEYSRG